LGRFEDLFPRSARTDEAPGAAFHRPIAPLAHKYFPFEGIAINLHTPEHRCVSALNALGRRANDYCTDTFSSEQTMATKFNHDVPVGAMGGGSVHFLKNMRASAPRVNTLPFGFS
jgi:hypothetical protein